MSVAVYDAAIAKLLKHGVEPDLRMPADAELIGALETRLNCKLPPSYRKMLAQFGVLSFDAQEIYGLGRSGLDGQSIPNVVFATESERRAGRITDDMVWIMSSGYGPIFVIDCAERRSDGECPILEIAGGGFQHGKARLADSFGDFLMGEVNLLVLGED